MGVRRSRSGALSLGARMRLFRQGGGSSAAASGGPGVGEIWCSSVCSLSEYEYRLRHHQTSYLGGGTSSTVSNAYPPPAPTPSVAGAGAGTAGASVLLRQQVLALAQGLNRRRGEPPHRLSAARGSHIF